MEKGKYGFRLKSVKDPRDPAREKLVEALYDPPVFYHDDERFEALEEYDRKNRKNSN